MTTKNSLMVERAQAMFTKLSYWRRKLHANPELSFKEFETSKFVTEILETIPGMKVQTGIAKTGVVGTLTNGIGPTIALRADMDALPITENSDKGYCSQNKGIMHACGHDAHTAILLGAAHLVAELYQEQEIQGTVKFIFQPAEETTDEHGLSGAPYMLQAGVFDDVDAALALHMCPWLPVGNVQLNHGYSMANVDVFQGIITGTGGHAAYPHLGSDPMWMIGPVLHAILGIVARKVSPLDSSVISVTQIEAGTASNIIPTEVTLKGTMRSYKPEIRELLISELEKAFSIVENLGGDYSVRVDRGEPALFNDVFLIGYIKDVIRDLYPEIAIIEEPYGLGGEDFGFITQVVPGSMFFLGCAADDEIERDLHTPIFDIDESCLSIGTSILVDTTRRLLTKQCSLGKDRIRTE
jgi:amidohydrolase